MSIDPTFCPSPAMAITIWLLWLCGVLAGGGLTFLSIRVYNQVHSSRDHKRQMEEEIAMAQRRQQEEAARIQLKQQEEALDEFMDEQIDCAECHPMFHLPFLEPRLCQKHSQLAQKKATSQQHPLVCHSFTVEAEVL